jgi:hypothetical protein
VGRLPVRLGFFIIICYSLKIYINIYFKYFKKYNKSNIIIFIIKILDVYL